VSAGTLILANRNLVVYNDLIHPFCHVETYTDVINKINYFESNPHEYDTMIKYQRTILENEYFNKPMESLYKKYMVKSAWYNGIREPTTDFAYGKITPL